MPQMTGLQVAAELLARPLRHRPTILLVSGTLDAPREDLHQVGIAGFIAKPLTASSLLVALEQEQDMRDSQPLTVAPPAAEPDTAGGQLAGFRVLLAEDNPLNQEVAVSLLEEFGLQVDVAEDGLIALERAAAVPYDLVLLDVQMPNMDGLSAARQLRQMAGYAQTPIVAMTANAFDEDRQMALAAGMNEHVAKPVDPDVLYAVLRRLLHTPTRQPDAAQAGSGAPPPAADILTRISGLDVTAGLRLVAGDHQRLIKLLRLFVDSHREHSEKIRHSMLSGDYKNVRLLVHSLKGAAATLGFKDLAQSAATVEKAVMAETPVNALAPDIDQLASRLASTLGEIRTTLPQADALVSASTPIDLPRLAADLTVLRRLLAEDNLNATDAYAAIEPQLKALAGRSASRLSLEIGDYDFAAALQTLDAIIEAQPALRDSLQ